MVEAPGKDKRQVKNLASGEQKGLGRPFANPSRNSARHAPDALRSVRPKQGCWLVNFLATFAVQFPNMLSPPRLDGLNEWPTGLDVIEEWLGLP